MLMSIFLGILVGYLFGTTEKSFGFSRPWTHGVVFGVVVGLINYLVPKTYLGVFALAFFAVMVGIFIFLIRRWKQRGDKVKEMAYYAILAFLLMWPGLAAAAKTAELFNLNGSAARLLQAIPFVLAIGTIAYVVGSWLLLYSARKKRVAVDPSGEVIDKKANLQYKGAFAGAIAVFAVAFMLALASLLGALPSWQSVRAGIANLGTKNEASTDIGGGNIDAEALEKAQEAEAQKALTIRKITPDELETLTLGKYKNISQQLLDSSLSSKDAQRVKATGFSDALTFGFESKEEEKMFLELEEEILRNPVYGVTVVNAIKDKNLGSKRIGELNPWMDEMSKLNGQYGVAYWLEDRREGDSDRVIEVTDFYVTDEYRQYAATLCTWLERLVSQGIHSWQTVENWCLNDVAKNNDRAGVPATYQYAKDALILSYVTKAEGAGSGEADGGAGNAEVADKKAVTGIFTIGFNIHDKRPEFYGEEPTEPTPETETRTPETEPTPGPGPSPSPEPETEPTPGPDPDPGYNKDPNKAPKENTEPNDDPGPGPDTNNGVGAAESTKDQPTNSNHYSSYDEYKEDINDLNEINQTQQQGGDSNEPSTPTPEGTNVDNNGDNGTGNGGIDNPTTDPSYDAPADGSDISSGSDGQWGGPSD